MSYSHDTFSCHCCQASQACRIKPSLHTGGSLQRRWRQWLLCRALGAHTSCHSQTCTQARADVTPQKEEEGRALKRLVVLGSFPIAPHLWHLPHDISLACDGAGRDGSYCLGTAPKPWSIRDKLCHCYSVLIQNLLLPGKWRGDLTAF